jgi:hypothetical protein
LNEYTIPQSKHPELTHPILAHLGNGPTTEGMIYAQ